MKRFKKIFIAALLLLTATFAGSAQAQDFKEISLTEFDNVWFGNAKLVEDILRDTVTALRRVENLAAFAVECENFESIHAHNAFASHEEQRDVASN